MECFGICVELIVASDWTYQLIQYQYPDFRTAMRTPHYFTFSKMWSRTSSHCWLHLTNGENTGPLYTKPPFHLDPLLESTYCPTMVQKLYYRFLNEIEKPEACVQVSIRTAELLDGRRHGHFPQMW
jgi:hypothetical protein